MSYAEMIPALRNLSRGDKLRVYRWLVLDLGGEADPDPIARAADSTDEAGDDIREDERIQAAARAMAVRNALGRMDEAP